MTRPQSDWERYQELSAQFLAAITPQKPFRGHRTIEAGSPEMELWAELEQIKNRHGGKPPPPPKPDENQIR
jgi:hypothetical protein